MKPVTFIRPARADEHDAITEVWEASVRATHHFLKEEDIQLYKPLVRNVFLKMVDLYCSEDNKKITGFLGVAGNKLEMLFLHPSAMGKGIGKQLMQFALKNLSVTLVDVNEQNVQAVGFYHHFGSITISRSETDGMGKPYPILNMQLKQQVH